VWYCPNLNCCLVSKDMLFSKGALGLGLVATTVVMGSASVRNLVPSSTRSGTQNPDRAVSGSSSAPADRFMASVAERDGSLGWRQLCPRLQQQVSEATVRQEANAQRASEEGQGVQLEARFMSSQSSSQGQTRYYLLTARRSDGWIGERTYIVQAGPGGCVEDVQNRNG
jgi:hypothetical protein